MAAAPDIKSSWGSSENPWSPAPPAGTWIDFRNMTELVCRAWMQHFALAFQATLDFDTLADLRAQASAVLDINDDAAPALARVGRVGRGQIWAWYRYSLDADDGATRVRPADVAAGDPGRWHLQTLPHVARCGTTRYLQHIEMCDPRTPVISADKKTTSLWTRCRAQTPALFLSFVEGQPEEASQTQAFHRVRLALRARVLSANWRGGVEARMTPGREEDQSADPGTYRAIGDLRDYIIKDNRLHPMLGTALLRTVLGAHKPVYDSGPDRVLCDSLDFTCIVSVWTPNTPCELASPFRIWVQLQDALGNDVGPENQIEAPERPDPLEEAS